MRATLVQIRQRSSRIRSRTHRSPGRIRDGRIIRSNRICRRAEIMKQPYIDASSPSHVQILAKPPTIEIKALIYLLYSDRCHRANFEINSVSTF